MGNESVLCRCSVNSSPSRIDLAAFHRHSLVAMSEDTVSKLTLPPPLSTGLEGFAVWPGLLDEALQRRLVDDIRDVVKQAPLYRPVTPAGRPFSVRMTNCGPLGWVSDRNGYRYQPHHPQTSRPWPAFPPLLDTIWQLVSGFDGPADACLVNFYDADARMGLHQDKDEQDFSAPVVSISLGDTAVFRFGSAEGGPTRSVKLASGDVCILSGPARLARHGIDRILPGTSRLLASGGRINLTLRRAIGPMDAIKS